MPEDISATGWLVIVCALALGFGVVRFMIVSMNDKLAQKTSAEANESATPSSPQGLHVEASPTPEGSDHGEPSASSEVLGASRQSNASQISGENLR
jgi:hypothetical protein